MVGRTPSELHEAVTAALTAAEHVVGRSTVVQWCLEWEALGEEEETASEPPGGSVTAVILEPGKDPSYRHVEGVELSDLQGWVGGYVETIQLDDETVMWVNEEGKTAMPPLPRNPSATALLDAAGGMASDYVVGTAVITGFTPSGEMAAVSGRWLSRFPVKQDGTSTGGH